MSLQFIIDGYNITNHPRFIKLIPKKYSSPHSALIQLIRAKKSSLSPHNRFWVIFDGYAQVQADDLESGNIRVVFSGRESADTRIKKLVELIASPKNTVVVSDDKEIRFFARSCGAKPLSVDDFLKEEEETQRRRGLVPEAELTYTQMQKINEELKKIWLS